MLTTNLKRAFSIDNLQRAWRWTRTNPDAQYKSYFRHIYRAYSLAIDKNLENLNKQLKNDTYKSVHSTKLYLPKKSGILRPYTLLSIEDQIVYQSLTNIVAEKLYPKTRRRYLENVFGHLYAGKNSLFFYRRWKDGYRAYSKALEDSYGNGYEYAAAFDLTACYDSIDHGVLSYFLEQIGLEKEFVRYLCEKLRHWSASSHETPIYQGHGIPQGPLPSGIISECVLQYFDQNTKTANKIKYFRYVDDIRLMAKSEPELRQELINLDLLSKNIGLFPQSSKIDIHKIKDINKEIKNISNPPEVVVRPENPDQEKALQRINELSQRYVVTNETRFKYVLGSAKPSAKLHRRLLKILEMQPHLYPSVFNNLRKARKLTKKVSEEYVKLLYQNTLYAAFTSNLINTLHGRLHKAYKASLTKFCQKYYPKTTNPQLKVTVSRVLIDSSRLTYKQKQTLIKYDNWWARSNIVCFLREDLIGKPSYETLMNKLLRDDIRDVAVVASDYCIKNNIQLHKPTRNINRYAQFPLKEAGLIGKISANECFIQDVVAEILGYNTRNIDWKKLTKKKYKEFRPKFVRWRGYTQTDPTAWVNITDTINDSILDILFPHDGTIGEYEHGRIGSVLNSGSKFARKYPMLFMAVCKIHEKRLESDLSHPKVKNTGKLTHYIKFKELKPLFRVLSAGYAEMWRKW